MRIIEDWAPAILIIALVVICHFVPTPHVRVGFPCGNGAGWVYSGSGAGVQPDLSCQERVSSSH